MNQLHYRQFRVRVLAFTQAVLEGLLHHCLLLFRVIIQLEVPSLQQLATSDAATAIAISLSGVVDNFHEGSVASLHHLRRLSTMQIAFWQQLAQPFTLSSIALAY